jgi:enoyl-CoA hydratase/carnithine racemase
VALACDLRVVRDGAFQIGLPEVNLGVLPGTGGTQRLSRLVGRSRAMEMMIEGSTLTVAQAASWGIVNKVWPAETHEGFMQQVMDYAHAFTPPNKAALAVGRMKRAVQSGSDMSLEQGLALERELQAELFATADAKEGLTAFTQKRKPAFRGR